MNIVRCFFISWLFMGMVAQAATVSGTVSLPPGDVAPAGGVELNLNAWDGTSNNNTNVNVNVIIPQGQSSVPYSIDVPDSADSIHLAMNCLTNCDGYYIDSYFYNAATSETYTGYHFYNEEALQGGKSHTDINMTLYRGIEISGTISLPAGETASKEFGVSIVAYEVKNAGQYNKPSHSSSNTVTFPAGASSVPYSVRVFDDSTIKWEVEYSCYTNLENGYSNTCDTDDYIRQGQYSNNGTKGGNLSIYLDDPKNSEFLVQGGQSNINLTIQRGIIFIFGNVSLPVGETAPIVGLSTWITMNSNQGNFGSHHANFTIPEGASSIPYRIAVVNDSLAEWWIDYSCNDDCTYTYYTSSGGTTNWEDRQFLKGGQNHSSINLTLRRDNNPPDDFGTPTTNHPPVLLTINDKSINIDDTLEFTVTANDPDGDNLTYRLDQAPTNANINAQSGKFNWKPSNAGTFDVTVRVTDDGQPIMSDTEIFNIMVEELENPPTIKDIEDQTVNLGEDLKFTAEVTDPNLKNLTFSLKFTPPGSTINPTTGEFTWTASMVGKMGITIEVTDENNLSDTESFAVTVVEGPTIKEIADQTINLGEELKLTAEVTDPNLKNLTFSLKFAPPGSTIKTTGEFTWTASMVGEMGITVEVIDENNLSDTESFAVAVTAAVADLAITQTSSPDLVAVGDKLTYTLTVHNTGPLPASAITVVKTLPKEVDFVDAYGTNWLCSEAQQTVTCELINNLAIGITAEPITINVIVSETVKENTLATVTATSSDPNNANNITNPDTTKVGYTLQTSVSATTRPDLLQPEAAKRVYLSDETVTLTATSKSCYKFDHWEGACEGEGPTCTLQMDGNQETTAHFQTPVLALDTSANNGVIAIAPAKPQYQCGDKVTLTATPNQTEDVFCGWMGDIVGKQNPISLILNENFNISAIFCGANAAVLPTKIYAKPGQKILFRASDNEDDNFFWAATDGAIDGNGVTATYQTPSEEGIFYVWASDGTGFTWSLIDTTSTDIQVILRIEPESLFLAPNEVKTVSVLGYRPDGTTVNLTAETVLHCENTTIAQVTQTGQVTAHNVGTTTLLANYHGLETKTSITVSSATQLLKVEPDIFVLREGSTIPIVVYAVSQTGTKTIYEDATFSIRDNNIATVNGNIVQGKRTGSTWLDVTAEKITLPIPVVTLYSPKLNITPSRATIERGETVSFSITGGEPPYQMTDVQLERENTFVYQSIVTGTAELFVTDNLNNQAKAVVETVTPLTVTPQQATIAPEGKVTLRANGGTGDYDWFINRGKLDKLTGDTVQYTAPTRTGLHTATVIDGMGNSQDVLILVGTELSLSQRQLFLTPGGKSQIRILGGKPEYQVTVSGGEVNLTTANNATIIDYTAPAVAGSYTIDVRDSTTQTISATVQVALDLLITPLAGRLDVGEKLNLHAAGGFGHKRWVASKGVFDKAEGKSVVWTAPQNFGTVLIYVSDMAGVTATATVEVSTTGLAITPSVRHVYPNEEVDFTVTGGSSPYTWTVEAGDYVATDNSIDYTAPPRKGIYQVTIHDNTGKEAQAQANVYSTNLLASPRTLYIQPNETLDIAISGGTGDYILQASLGEVINNVEVAENEISIKTEYTAPSGYYGHDTIRIRDTAGNLATINVEIAKPTDIVSTYAGPDGRIDEVEMEQALQDYFVGQYWLQDRTVMFLIVEQFQLNVEAEKEVIE